MNVLAEKQAFKTETGIALMRQYSTTLDPRFKDVLHSRYALEPWGAATLNLLGAVSTYEILTSRRVVEDS
jgi:hypothetical protein